MKRMLCVLLVVVAIMLSVIPAMAAVGEPTVSPCYAYIQRISAGLSIDETLGITSCKTSCFVAAESVKLTCTLQRYNGSSWTTVKSWSETGEYSVALNKNWAVYSGYTYRVKATCSVYNSSGALVESGSIYSNEVVY